MTEPQTHSAMPFDEHAIEQTTNIADTSTDFQSGSRRRSAVSIAESTLPGGHPEMVPNPTPRGRRSNQAGTSDQSQLPAPFDDVFKSSLWPSLPVATSSLESLITHTKLDLIMAYLQDVRVTQNNSAGAATRVASKSSRGGSSVSSTKTATRRASLPKDFVKFSIAADDIDTIQAQAQTATVIDSEFSQQAIRLFITENGKDCSFTKLTKNAKEAGIRFRDFVLNLAEGISQEEQAEMQNWNEKQAGDYFMKCLKDRRRAWEEENDAGNGEGQGDEEAGAAGDVDDNDDDDGQGGSSMFFPEYDPNDGGESSEPVRTSLGRKSSGKGRGSSSSKRVKATPATHTAQTQATSSTSGRALANRGRRS